MTRAFVTISALMLLGACSTQGLLTSTEPQQTIYALRGGAAEPASANGPARIIEIGKPALPPGFESDRIALYTQGGAKLDYFAGARWADTLDIVVQDFTRRTLTETLPYAVAINGTPSVDANYRVETKINDFQPVYEGTAAGAPMLKVSAEFTLVSLPEERIVRSFTLSKNEDASADNLDAITSGLDDLLRSIETEAFRRIDAVMKPAAPAEMP